MINLFIIIVIISTISLLVYLNINFDDVKFQSFFTIFVFIATIERIWEVFFTSKDRRKRKFQGDWFFLIIVSVYSILSLLMIIEFFNNKLNLYLAFLGMLLFLFSTILRLWSIYILNNNWTIHIFKDLSKNSNYKLIKNGPYKFIRHPIYLGSILDLIALSLITNALLYLIFISLIVIPLYLFRSKFEDKELLNLFGIKYSIYKKEVSSMLPLKYFKHIMKVK